MHVLLCTHAFILCMADHESYTFLINNIGTFQAPARCARTTILSAPLADIVIEQGEVNCFACSRVPSWTANDAGGVSIPVTPASPLVFNGITVVEIEEIYLILPSPGQYILPGIGGQRNIQCSDNIGNVYKARLANPSK